MPAAGIGNDNGELYVYINDAWARPLHVFT